jgi:hypothetical protein
MIYIKEYDSIFPIERLYVDLCRSPREPAHSEDPAWQIVLYEWTAMKDEGDGAIMAYMAFDNEASARLAYRAIWDLLIEGARGIDLDALLEMDGAR